MSKTNSNIDCFQCRHFFITWEAHQPRGCKAFGFKTQKMPSVVVFESSGENCLKFQPKQTDQERKKSNGNGWIA